MADWIDRLARAPDGVLLFVAIAAAFALLAGFSGLRRTRRIEDVPTARVRSAHQGYVELIGSAHMLDGEAIVAPLSNTSCCWYRYRVERRSGKDWRTVQSGTSDGIFLLRDDSGECVIDPEGAEVTTSHRQTWFGNEGGWGGNAVHARLPSLGRGADLVVGIGGRILSGLGGGGSYRYTEAVILDGDPLYAMGEFHSLGSGGHGSDLDALTGAVLREWKLRPDGLQQRFDSNRDGVIDIDEWEAAREAARNEAARTQAELSAAGPVHTLRKPRDRRYFLLSNLEEFGLLRRYRWRMRLGFLGFLLAAAACVLMLSSR